MHEAMLDIGLVDDALRNTIASVHEIDRQTDRQTDR